MTSHPKLITNLLHQMGGGDQQAANKLFPIVYKELRKISKNQLKREQRKHTLNTTALVNEAYIKLMGKDDINLQNRAHFFALAARSMREILLDYARKWQAEKRGGDQPLVTFDESMKPEMRADELIALDEVLKQLQNEIPRVSKVVELKFFGGLTYEEIANALTISVPTVRRDWRFAKAWLYDALGF